jgi:triacylglycerol lipase
LPCSEAGSGARKRADLGTDTPKHPIVLAHGLLGFDELRLAGTLLPGVHYWRGITEAMKANGMEIITASVPASGSIEERAKKLGEDIAEKANGKSVNIIAHSMGGLDGRYMISRLKPDNVEVLSLTTIATPHRGSAFADFVFAEIGSDRLPHLYKFLDNLGINHGAFCQLTRKYMKEEFNPKTPDKEGVRYFSYGATVNPSIWSAFRQPGRIMTQEEGPNDGLVSVESAKWGTYKGTLVDVSHLDLINWTNRLRWFMSQALGNERK